MMEDGVHNIEALEELLYQEVPPFIDVIKRVKYLTKRVEEGGVPERDLAIQKGAYEAVITAWSTFCDARMSGVLIQTDTAEKVREATMAAMYSLTAGHPEIVDDRGIEMIKQSVDYRITEYQQIQTLKTLRNMCVKSEKNRERLTWEENIIEPLIQLIKTQDPSPNLIREWCSTITAFCLSDDPTVTYNRAPERKRLIFNKNIVPTLVGLFNDLQQDQATLNAIVVTLQILAAVDEFCISMEKENVLAPFTPIFRSHFSNKTLMRNVVSFLRYLNISEYVRDKCGPFGLVRWVIDTIQRYQDKQDMVEIGFSCLAFMTLKNACHAAQFVQISGAECAVKTIEMNQTDVPILKVVCMTLRNVILNGEEKAKVHFEKSNVVPTLRNVAKIYPDFALTYIFPTLKAIEDPKSGGSTS